MIDLKPCPFCGGKARLISGESKQKQCLSPLVWQVICTHGCVAMPIEFSDHDAINAWNRRVEVKKIQQDSTRFSTRLTDELADIHPHGGD